MDKFWEIIERQIAKLREAQTADRVMEILDGKDGAGFFGGSGGDDQVCDALSDAGWSYVRCEADYYWCMKAPNGDLITYVEGDVFRGDQMVAA